jgi:hypothetical protein
VGSCHDTSTAIRYFFIKDRVVSGKVKIEQCPTKDMVADIFTKPQPAAQFIKFRNEIMNVNPSSIENDLQDCRSVLNNIITGVIGHNDRTNGHETDTGCSQG